MITLMDANHDFKLQPGLIYLNHAAVSPWPQRTVTAIQQFATENGALGSSNYPTWLEVEQRLRERLSRLLGVGTVEDIALLKNTSEALSIIAHGLQWRDGESVVTSDQEFPSNSMVWESLDRYGVSTRKVDLNSAATPEDALIAAVDSSTRLLSISSVQFSTGLKMDLERLGAFCRAQGILFCVDAIQSLGACRFDGAAIQPDFVVADGHKWMMAPEGCALFYSTPEARAALQLYQYGWHMREAPFEFDPLSSCEQSGCCDTIKAWRVAGSARRFEPGSPNMLGIHGLEASLSLLEAVGMDTVEAELRRRMALLIEALQQHPALTLLTPSSPERHAGIVTFTLHTLDPALLFQQLTEEGIQCAQRGGGIRLSPHFYTPVAQLEQTIEKITFLSLSNIN